MDSEKFVARYAKNLSLEGIEKAILCFSSATAKKLQSLHKGKRIHCLGASWDIYTKNKSVVVSHFGVGSGASLLQFEYLKAFKMPLIFSLGAIASFNKKIKLGQQLFIQQAYEEKHFSSYLNPLSNRWDKESPLSEQRIEKQKNKQKEFKKQTNKTGQIADKLFIQNPYKKMAGQLTKDLSLNSITSLSCDIPYNIQKINYPFYISHKISGLEMEAFALISAGKQHKIPLFCMAVVSDFLNETNWEMGFSRKEFQNSLFELLEKLLFYKFH